MRKIKYFGFPNTVFPRMGWGEGGNYRTPVAFIRSQLHYSVIFKIEAFLSTKHNHFFQLPVSSPRQS